MGLSATNASLMAPCIAPVGHLVGLPGSKELLLEMRDEIKQRIADGVGSVPDERYRLYYDGILTWPKLGVLGRKFATMDACVVAGAYSHLLFMPRPEKIDPDQPLESIAWNLCAGNMDGDFDQRANAVADLCEKYSIDGLVMSETQTCRGINYHTHFVADAVARRLGIPSITIGGDMCDARFYTDAQVDTRLQALLETIDAGRKTVK